MVRCEQCGLEHEDELLVCPRTGKLFRPDRIFPRGTVLEGKYRIEGVLGAGGMGAVFRATHTLLNKVVAVKLTLPDFARDEQMTARMVREARAASSTGHRNIAAVTDMGWTDEGGLFIVMEYLAGTTLQRLIEREGRLTVPRSAEIVSQMLSGLAAVHAKGVVHRDLKPENVMLVQDEEGVDQVKILDFGISKVVGDDKSLDLTQTGLVMGSPRYMSPEQARGTSRVDQRVDIYATGGILYTLLVGRPPLGAENYHAMLAAILSGCIESPSTVVSGIPRALDRIVLRAMALDPGARYSDAASFRRDLEPYVDRPAPAALRATPAALAAPGDGAAIDDALWSADALVALDEVPGRAPAGGPACSPPAAVSTAELSEPTFPALSTEEQSLALASPQPHAPPVGHGADSFERNTATAGPAVEETSLELELDEGWRGSDSASRTAERWTREAPPNSSLRKDLSSGWLGSTGRTVGLIVAIAILGAAAWHYRKQLSAFVAGEPVALHEEDSVFVLLETNPPEADIYVDGVLQVTRPIALPRSEQQFSIRVQANGYRSKRVRVRADQTRTVRVQLRRLKRQ
jgi:predicted Ser/Thr protein kinase